MFGGHSVVIFSRNGREFTNRFPGIRDALLTLPCKSAVIDGEVVACKADGTPDFRALHSGNYTQEILYHPYVRYSEPFKNGEQLLAECRERGLEGIVSKRKHSPYKSGKCDWVKVKCESKSKVTLTSAPSSSRKPLAPCPR
jgi:bifunctional non-homologous end joining protein LigD